MLYTTNISQRKEKTVESRKGRREEEEKDEGAFLWERRV